MLAELSNVTKSYRSDAGAVPVLNGISLTIAEGETVAITGPSGCGKSTLLNLLGALDQADSGEIRVAGRDLTKLDAQQLADFRNTTVGFVFQLHHLLPQCTVLENVLVPSIVRKDADRAALRARAAQLLGAVGLSHRLDHRPGQLSGGERQRAAVARALINSPKLLLADEPTGALDRASAERLADLLAEVHQREKITIVMVTHSPELACRMGRMLPLLDGRLSAV
ncbi:MAG: ABC transporter ATP-binding protein [Verrucomicrobia bacterium]|nr:MAG: ABC transporter ATP-binding protein [Verrucomicrobiota bacterium]